MISVEEADVVLRRCIVPFGVEECALGEAAGRVLRQEVRADRCLPPYDRVAMDGIAVTVRALEQGVRRFVCEGVQRAGAPALALAADHGCIEVATGAVLPAGCDCVIRHEDVDLAAGTATLRRTVPAERWRNVHRSGTDRAGGAVLLEPGIRLGAPQVAVAASAGMTTLRVGARPRIAVVSTGDELVPVGEVPRPWQVRRSNGDALRALLADAGLPAAGPFHFPDDEPRLLAGLASLLREHDVLVLSGGVSAGRFDHVPSVLERLGVERRFHGIRQRPGKPFWFGRGAHDGKLVFALPGNPVSALVCAARYVVPALLRACGLAERPGSVAVLAGDVVVPPGLTLFVPAAVRPDGGRMLATPVPVNGSGDFSGLAASDGFLEVAGAGAAGSAFPWHAWR
jgi:molybdopterin molybdotransferase